MDEKINGKQDFKRLLILLAAGLTFTCIACFMLAMALNYNLPGEAIGFLTAVTMAAVGVLVSAAAYEFASSRGSQLKDEATGDVVRKIVRTAETVVDTAAAVQAKTASPTDLTDALRANTAATRSNTEATQPTEEPVKVEVVNPPDAPVPVQEAQPETKEPKT